MEHNAGATCLSIAISNYLSNKEHLKTAYIELNSSKEISSLKDRHVKFKYLGIDFYPEITIKKLSDIYNMNYDTFVIDFGILNNYTHSEFKRCDKQIALCLTPDWKSAALEAFLKKLYENNTDPNKLILLGNPCSKKLNIPKGPLRNSTIYINEIPSLPNPFQLPSYKFGFFEELTEKEKINYHERSKF